MKNLINIAAITMITILIAGCFPPKKTLVDTRSYNYYEAMQAEDECLQMAERGMPREEQSDTMLPVEAGGVLFTAGILAAHVTPGGQGLLPIYGFATGFSATEIHDRLTETDFERQRKLTKEEIAKGCLEDKGFKTYK